MAGKNRYENLGFRLAETWIDVAYSTQERAAAFGESYLNMLQEEQKTSFGLVLAWLKQMQELQMLTFGYFQESARSGNETVSNLLRVQDEVRQDVKDRFEQQMTEIEKVAKVSTK